MTGPGGDSEVRPELEDWVPDGARVPLPSPYSDRSRTVTSPTSPSKNDVNRDLGPSGTGVSRLTVTNSTLY